MTQFNTILIVKITAHKDGYLPIDCQGRVESLLNGAFYEPLVDGLMDFSITSDSHSGKNIPEDVQKKLISYLWLKPQAFETLAKKYLSQLTDTELGNLLAEAGESIQKGTQHG